MEFFVSSGEAEARQFQGEAQGAQQVGAALLFVNDGSMRLLEKIEDCLAKQSDLSHGLGLSPSSSSAPAADLVDLNAFRPFLSGRSRAGPSTPNSSPPPVASLKVLPDGPDRAVHRDRDVLRPGAAGHPAR